MTTFTESHARLSYKSYDPGSTGIDTDAFELVIESNRASGYRGFIFRNNITKDYVVAHTGTEFDTDKIRDALLTDGQMVLADVNQQLDDAQNQMEPSPAGFKKATRASSRRLNQSLLESELHGLR